MKAIIRFLILFIGTIVGVSCCKDTPPQPAPEISNTVLVYLAADNSLSGISSHNIEQMMVGMERCDPQSNLLVYVDDKTAPRLFQIRKDSKGKVSKVLIKEYTEHNSASKEVMRSVVEEVFQSYPARYKGLVLWSHGLNWFPVGYYGNSLYASTVQRVSGIKRSFGQDYVNGRSIEMSLSDLEEAIPDIDLDFIAFDACYMGSVEVAYALRNKAKQLIASPTEILEEGFPYSEVLNYMLIGVPQTTALAQRYFDHYNIKTGIYRSASISVIDLSEMERLADWTKRNFPLLNKALDVYDLQHFDRLYYRLQFDFKHLYSVGLNASDLASRIAELDEIIGRLIIYKAATPYFICDSRGISVSQGFQIQHFCGLSSYYESSSYTYLNQEYKLTDWYKATH